MNLIECKIKKASKVVKKAASKCLKSVGWAFFNLALYVVVLRHARKGDKIEDDKLKKRDK